MYQLYFFLNIKDILIKVPQMCKMSNEPIHLINQYFERFCTFYSEIIRVFYLPAINNSFNVEHGNDFEHIF